MDGRRPDWSPFMLDDPEDVVLALRHSVEPLVLRADRGREAQEHEAGDLEVLEPLDHHRSVARTWRTQTDKLALDDRPVHGRRACVPSPKVHHVGDRLRPLWGFDDLDGSERRFE